MRERSLGFFGTPICGPALDFDCRNLPELAGRSSFPGSLGSGRALVAPRSSVSHARGKTIVGCKIGRGDKPLRNSIGTKLSPMS
jgi:hypothetical protein